MAGKPVSEDEKARVLETLRKERNIIEKDGGGALGKLADHPRGDGGFGWDRIFCPEGYRDQTRAELTQEQNKETYQTIKPIKQLRELLQEE